MVTCADCGKSYLKIHTCKVGVCASCGLSLKNLAAHRCPVVTCMALDLRALWTHITTQSLPTCVACGVHHFLNKNIHGFRSYHGVLLCWDCYSIPEIQADIHARRRQLLSEEMRSPECRLCHRLLLDPVTGTVLCAYERDHVDVFAKVSTIWELLVTGVDMATIRREAAKCRLLCVRCHSAVTCAQRAVGLCRLKSASISDAVRQRATSHAETLARMLLELDVDGVDQLGERRDVR